MQQRTDIDEFILRFRDYPRERTGLVEQLIGENSRLTLNLPRSGPARRISALLGEGPFSDFYEFEKVLARLLHPFLAGLNLNVIADVRVSRLFEKKFKPYAKQFQKVLAANNNLTQAAVKGLILDMIRQDGHYMVVKFYDLVIRPIHPDLFRSVQPVELALIKMKNSLGRDAVDNEKKVREARRAFKKRNGAGAAALLRERIGWDDDLDDYISRPGDDEDKMATAPMEQEPAENEGEIFREIDEGPEKMDSFAEEPAEEQDAAFDHETAYDREPPHEDALAGDDVILLEDIAVPDEDNRHEEPENEEAPEPEEEASRENRNAPDTTRPVWAGEGRIARYAAVLKEDFLLQKRPDDEEGIREFVDGMYAKNKKTFGADRAAEILHAVLSIWIKDEMLNGWMRGILSDILDERYGTYSVHEGQGDIGAMDDSIAMELEDAEAAEIVQAEDVAPAEAQLPEEPDNSEAELQALLAGIGDEPPGEGPLPAGGAQSGRGSVPDQEDVEPMTGDTADEAAAPSLVEEIDHIEMEDVVPVVEVSSVEEAGGEEFLISEEEFSEITKSEDATQAGEVPEENILIETDEEFMRSIKTVEPGILDLTFKKEKMAGKRFAASDPAGRGRAPEETPGADDIAADPFIVKDEILFEDRSLKRKKRNDAKG